MKKASFIVILLIISLLSFGQNGIDVSHHQGKIDWNLVAKDKKNIQFVYVKASEGSTGKDKNYKFNMVNARKNRLLVGAYHYFRMTSSAHKQFDNFSAQLDACDFDLIPMVDVETCDGCPVKELQDSLSVFFQLIQKKYGVLPMIYGTQQSYNTYCAPTFNHFYLYIGRFNKSAPTIIGPGKHTIWQYSETGKVKGINKNVDLCKFRDKRDFEKIIMTTEK